MSNGSFIALVSNVSLLVAMVFVYDLAGAHPLNLETKLRQVMIGVGLSIIAVAVMATPWVFEPGIVFDTRSVLIGLSGLFFGAVPTVIVMIVTSTYRIFEGGAAAFTGICVIIASGVIGLVWHRTLKRPLITLTWRNLLGLGYAVHLVMLALMFTLPWQTALYVLGYIALPVLTIYPLAMAAIGALMVNRLKHEQANEALKQSEMHFRALSEQAAIGVTKAETASGRYVFVNQRFADIVGYTRDELLGMDFHALTYPDDLTDDLNNVDHLVKGELHEYSIEKRYLRKDGAAIWVNLTVSPLWQAGEPPQYLIGLVEDISERKRTEEALTRLNRELQAISSCNQTLLRAVDEQTLLNDICRIVCDQAGYCLAWVGYAEHDDAKTVRPVAWAGSDSGYVANADITWADTERGRGPSGTAIRSGETVCINDFTTVPQTTRWRDRALQHGYRSAIVLPLKDDSAKAFGVFLIYSSEPTAITPDEIRLLEELSRDLAFGIMVLRGRTERKRAEEALRASEERYRLLVENQTDLIIKTDPDGRLIYASPSYCVLFGKSLQELTGFNFILSMHPDDLTAIKQAIARLFQPPYFCRCEGRAMTPRGWRWIDWTARAELDSQGRVVGFVGSGRDITDRKQAEEETQRERAFFDRLVETAPEGIAITDAQGMVLRVNAEFVRMFGYEVDEAVGQSIDDLLAPLTREKEAKEITRATGQGETILLETVRRRKDGTLVDVSLIGAPIMIAGKQEATYAIYRDITERKQAEEAREKAESQLRQAQKMEAIGALAGGVAHDFNNLLTGILGNISIIRSSLPTADPMQENLNAAETSARQAANLTRGLLTFSRSAIVLPVPMNMTAALDATLALLKQSLPATMEIVRDDVQTPWNVLVDQSQITQILLNLAVNARDAMKGKGTLTIRTRNEVVGEAYVQTHPFARTGEFVHLSVTDTGTGIPPEIREHLFEPFHTTKPIGAGTGLGLSIVYGAVKQAGGWITAASTEGAGKNTPQKHPSDWENIRGSIGQTCSGATFDIYLPRCLEKATPSFTPVFIPANAGSGTVLVAEDEPVVCAVAQAFLSRSGYAVLTAPDGASALNTLREYAIDIGLILLDMTMPGMTTDEIVPEMRALSLTIPILLTSGYTSNDTVTRMLEDGSVQGFVAKPYDLHQLLDKVQSLLHRG